VGINKEYVIRHGRSQLDNKYKIITMKVKASQVFTEGYIEEWGFDPN
jgi:hypothetical protein